MQSTPDEPPRLIASILGDRRVDEFVRDENRATEIAEQLAPLRDAGVASVIWWGVNQARIDAGIRTDDDEWRIVYGTHDDEWIEWLSVYSQPPRFDGVSGGRAVIVNGPSGAGKSSLLDAIRRQSPLPWVAFDEPVLGAVNEGYLVWPDRAPALHRGFLTGIAALARAGNCVAVAAAAHPPALFDECFEGVEVVRVGLDCDLETLRSRELGRQGRWGGIAASSVGVHDGWSYQLRYDTTEHSPDAIAAEVLRAVGARPASEDDGPPVRFEADAEVETP